MKKLFLALLFVLGAVTAASALECKPFLPIPPDWTAPVPPLTCTWKAQWIESADHEDGTPLTNLERCSVYQTLDYGAGPGPAWSRPVPASSPAGGQPASWTESVSGFGVGTLYTIAAQVTCTAGGVESPGTPVVVMGPFDPANFMAP